MNNKKIEKKIFTSKITVTTFAFFLIVLMSLMGCSSKSTNERFFTVDKGIIVDSKTGLMWAANGYDQNINWHNADEYCDNLQLGGYSDWRVPTQEDLLQILAYSSAKNDKTLKYIDVRTRKIWTSDVDESSNFAAYYDLEFFTVYYTPMFGSMKAGVVPVRGIILAKNSKQPLGTNRHLNGLY